MKTLKNHVIGIYLILFSLYSISTRFTMTAALMDGTWNNFIFIVSRMYSCRLAVVEQQKKPEKPRNPDTRYFFRDFIDRHHFQPPLRSCR